MSCQALTMEIAKSEQRDNRELLRKFLSVGVAKIAGCGLWGCSYSLCLGDLSKIGGVRTIYEQLDPTVLEGRNLWAFCLHKLRKNRFC